jgi:hypothetical protein
MSTSIIQTSASLDRKDVQRQAVGTAGLNVGRMDASLHTTSSATSSTSTRQGSTYPGQMSSNLLSLGHSSKPGHKPEQGQPATERPVFTTSAFQRTSAAVPSQLEHLTGGAGSSNVWSSSPQGPGVGVRAATSEAAKTSTSWVGKKNFSTVLSAGLGDSDSKPAVSTLQPVSPHPIAPQPALPCPSLL